MGQTNCLIEHLLWSFLKGSLGWEGLDGGRGQTRESQECRDHRPGRWPRGADDQDTQVYAHIPSNPEQVVHSHQGAPNPRLEKPFVRLTSKLNSHFFIFYPGLSGSSRCCLGSAEAAVRPGLSHATHIWRQGKLRWRTVSQIPIPLVSVFENQLRLLLRFIINCCHVRVNQMFLDF